MRIFLSELDPSSVTNITVNNNITVSKSNETYIYSDNGILSVTKHGLHRINIKDNPTQTVMLCGMSAIIDPSTFEKTEPEFQIPVPSVEVNIFRTKYTLSPTSPTWFVVEKTDNNYTNCYFETEQNMALLEDDITTLLSQLNFC